MNSHVKSLFLFLAFVCSFTVSALAQIPANDNCANAKLIKSDSTCVTGTSRLLGETLTNATNQAYTIPSTCGYLATARDVWYKFAAKTKYPTITISNPGSGWGGIANVRIQLLTGSCGTFTQQGCTTGATLTPALTSTITPGDTCYIRIHRDVTTAIPANYTFDICVTDVFAKGSRMNEIFSRTVLSAAGVLNYPWEIAYGPDNNLWITEAQGYRVVRMNPNTGVKTTVLNLATNATGTGALTAPSDTLNAQAMGTWSPWPQGGFAGMAIHPQFGDGSGHDFVYVAYVHRSLGGTSPSGLIYRNKLVRFTWNGTTLGTPAVLCDTLPGSKDHNSQRMIIAPVVSGDTNFLFYASGDMGSGQFENRTRPMRAQIPGSYEGKILRFNLDTVGGIPWIPTSNPYSSTSAVYSIGIRNNQGFAYDPTTNILYGSSHGAYSDDEINIIESKKNYGHPLVIGYADGNYNGNASPGTSTSISAGSPWTDNNGASTCPPIGSETTRMNNIITSAATGGTYRGPLFSAYATPAATIANTWATNPGNANWLSEAWSGLDLYKNKIIPYWNRSLIASGLKWGRLVKLKLGTTGTTTLPSNLDSLNTADTVTYFQSTNRYRDLAFAPNGKDVFLVMDNSSATSGPGVGNPTVPACPGCVIKYSFVGYADAGGFSTISKLIPVTDAPAGTCNAGTPVTIDGSNNFIWVPITGPDGSIMAEINAMGQNLGLITSSFYKNPYGSIRVSTNGVHYLDRSITITPAVTSFATPVKVRLYITKAELDLLIADGLSNVTSISNLKILKNNDPSCSPYVINPSTSFVPTNTVLADLQHGTNGYVLQTAVPSFSSFYFANSAALLPVDQLTFSGSLQADNTTLLKWKTENEINTSRFVVERSIDGTSFTSIGTVAAHGNSNTGINYSYNDAETDKQGVLVVYYRLKVEDANGSFKYSNIISVTLAGTKGAITIYPNPATNELNASMTSPVAVAATWQILDNAGRTIMTGTTALKKGSNKLSINISRLAAGAYYLQLSATDVDMKTKFQKL